VKNIIIAAWNINGLTPNKSDVEILIKEHNLDIVLVSESHCTAASNIIIQGYNTYLTNHPDGTAHAGTAIIIKKSIKHNLMPAFQTNYLQATTISVETLTGGRMVVSAVYCPPKHKVTEGMFTDYFKTLGNRFVSGGDWNSKHTFWGSRLITTRGRQLKTSIDNNNLMTVSTSEPTYWPTDTSKIPDLLDFFVFKGLSKEYFRALPCHDSTSDHTPVLLRISTLPSEYDESDKLYNRQTDWQSFREFLEERIELKVALKTQEDLENATKYITSLIQQACWLNTPTIQYKIRPQNFSTEVRQMVLEKRRLRRVWHLSRLKADKCAFEVAALKLKNLIKNWYDTSLQSKLESLTATASTNYSLWKFTKSYNRPQDTKPPMRDANNSWARTSQEKADAFAAHLSKVFVPHDTHYQSPELEAEFMHDLQLSPPLKPVTPQEIYRTIRNLKDKKAPGFDLITKEILMQLPRKAILFLTVLFNGILRVQVFPSLWKVSQIMMIRKPGKPAHEMTSYRPISLLPILSKLFERMLLRRLHVILRENKIIPEHQFGFREKHATVEQVHRVCNKIRSSLENKQYCSSVFLDIEQAFDRVWHRGLLYKIKTMLPHSFYLLLQSYLQERLFQVKEADATSSFHEIKAGVPQGSVLGPVLYVLYTSDLPRIENVTTATFADDTAILASSADPIKATETLQKGLNLVTEWLRKWRIKASANKSVQVTFALRKGNCPPVQLENKTLPHKDTVRYLGLHLDRRLTWKHHIKTKREELNLRYKELYWLLGRNSRLSTDNKLLIYKSVLKPVWTYGLQLWGSASNSNISILQRMQNIILRSISQAPWLVTNDEIHRNLEINSVKDEISSISKKYQIRLKNHPNQLAVELTRQDITKRLKRKNIMQLHMCN
jgi:hypothetical protein